MQGIFTAKFFSKFQYKDASSSQDVMVHDVKLNSESSSLVFVPKPLAQQVHWLSWNKMLESTVGMSNRVLGINGL